MPAVLIVLVVLVAVAFYFDREEKESDGQADLGRKSRSDIADLPG